MKAHNRIINILVIALAAITVSVFCGCTQADNSPIHSTFYASQRQYMTTEQGIYCDYGFSKIEQKIDDTQITVYYGLDKDAAIDKEIRAPIWDDSWNCVDNEDATFVAVGLYFQYCSVKELFPVVYLGLGTNGSNYDLEKIQHDYKNYENTTLVKELAREEFTPQKYCVSRPFLSMRLKYKYYETLTVPKVVFKNSDGLIVVSLKAIYQRNSDSKYLIHGEGREIFGYEKLDEENIKIISFSDWEKKHREEIKEQEKSLKVAQQGNG